MVGPSHGGAGGRAREGTQRRSEGQEDRVSGEESRSEGNQRQVEGGTERKAAGEQRCKAEAGGGRDRRTGPQVLEHDPGVLSPRDEQPGGGLPRPISSGSRENKELRSRREGRRGGLIRASDAAAPSAPLGSSPTQPSTSKAPLLISTWREGRRGGTLQTRLGEGQRERLRHRRNKETEGERDGEGKDGVMDGVEGTNRGVKKGIE